MNVTMIRHLVSKDWQFNRAALMLYTVIGICSLGLISYPNKAAFYTGMVLMISMIVIVGAHLIFATVISERKEQTLAFLMSLPISIMEYTTAKMLINIGAFILIWTLFAVGTVGVIVGTESIPNGILPFASITLLELFVAYVLILAVAIITESEVWTIVMMTIANICISLFWFFVGSIKAIGLHMDADTATWNSAVYSFISIEILAIVMLIGLIFYFQSRKKDFL